MSARSSRYQHWDEHGDEGCGGDDTCDSIESEPDCVEDLDHSWTREGEGGCDSNPGVWSLGGTTYQFAAHCRYCGARKTTILHGSQRDPYECDSVHYEEGERNETAIVAEIRRRKRNRMATRRRHALALAQYGTIEAWREAVRHRRAAVLRANVAKGGAVVKPRWWLS